MPAPCRSVPQSGPQSGLLPTVRRSQGRCGTGGKTCGGAASGPGHGCPICRRRWSVQGFAAKRKPSPTWRAIWKTRRRTKQRTEGQPAMKTTLRDLQSSDSSVRPSLHPGRRRCSGSNESIPAPLRLGVRAHRQPPLEGSSDWRSLTERQYKRAMSFMNDDATPKKMRIYDNDGKTKDCYTAVFTGRYRNKTNGMFWHVGFNGVPTHPQMGIYMHGESHQQIDYPKYSHLGRRIKFSELPDVCQRCLLEDYIYLWELVLPPGIANNKAKK